MSKKKNKKKASAENAYQRYLPDEFRLEQLKALIKPAANTRIYTSYIFILILLIFAHPNPFYFIIGTAFIMAGSYQRIMASGTLIKAAKEGSDYLIMTGPYSKCRHPLYFGSFLNGIGFVFLAGPLGEIITSTRETYLGPMSLGLIPWGLVPFILLMIPVYYRMIRIEEDFLAEKFGPLYGKYRGVVPCFLPRLSLFTKDPNWQFDPERVRANREMKNFTWLMVVYGLFFIKLLYFLIRDFAQISAS